mgnify:CR=1 FL=1
MNNNRLTASKSKAALEEQSYDLIQQHIIDPENSPLPEHLCVQCNRVLQIARLLDDYPNESHIINIMLAKYRISRTQIRKDIAPGKRTVQDTAPVRLGLLVCLDDQGPDSAYPGLQAQR